jgi:hypothetical protein
MAFADMRKWGCFNLRRTSPQSLALSGPGPNSIVMAKVNLISAYRITAQSGGKLFARFGAPHMICGMNAWCRMLLAHVPSQPSAPSTDLPKPFPTSLCHEKNVIDLQVCDAGPSALLRTRAAAPAVESWFPTATATRLSFYYAVVEIKPLAFEASANRQLVLGRSPFSFQDMGNCGTGEKPLFENIPSIQ